MRQVPIICLFLFLTPGFAVTQSPTGPNVGEGFVPLLNSFEAELNILVEPERGERCCDPKKVNAVLGKTRTDILQLIPADDAPLRRYAEQSMPAPLDESTELARKQDVESVGAKVRGLLSKLTSLNSYRLDLTITTKPQKARFELFVSGLSRISTTTNDRLSNVYRGEYEYTVEKKGYKSVRETINFIDRAGNTLVCELVRDPDPQPALPCQLR